MIHIRHIPQQPDAGPRVRRSAPARRASVLLGLLACAWLLGPGSAVALAQTPGLTVTGYQEAFSPTRDITHSAPAMSTVGVDGVTLFGTGNGVSRPSRGARRQLRVAHRDHLRASLLIANWSNSINDFSEPIAHRLFSDSGAIDHVARSLVRDVRRQHWDGITVDLESLAPRDTRGLVRFVRALHRRLPSGRTLSVDVTNYRHASYFPGDGYNLRALGRAADEIVLMGYDQHGPWENRPGPVGALAWQRAGLRIVLRSVPARKLTLGVAGYGYVWGPHSNRTVGDARARALVARDHVTATFKRRVGEWTATLSNGATMWWSDARSYALRARLARRLHLHGLAVWSLGLSDPLRT